MQVLLVNNNKFASEQMLKQSFHSGACSANRRLADDMEMLRARHWPENHAWPLENSGTRLSERKEDSSALTGQSLEKIAAAADAVWHSKRKVAVVDR